VYRPVSHGRYDVRDRFGHYVNPVSAGGRMCPHKCCQGKRSHPDKVPVKLDRTVLRSMSEPELEAELRTYSHYGETHEAGLKQVIAELDRRDRAEQAAQRRRHRRESANSEYQDEVYRQWLHAENATKGVMLNKAGLKAGIDERSLFTGPEVRVRKYASPELIEWFESHPRPTRASWFGSAKSRRAHLAGRRIG
jgi:hypothetical protein